MMQANNPTRRQLIETALTQDPEAVVPVTIRLWERLAPELISIIGEGGFTPLYARSVRLACARYPWMAQGAAPALGHARFTELQALLQAQDLVQASQASMALFTIFLDVLASLIGEELTTHLLHSAWSQETSETPAKDFPA
ncbi:hypothetical protein BH10PSE16_BH10PSE16_23090 [soil metagenome]